MTSDATIVVISNCTPRDILCLGPLASAYPNLKLIVPDYSASSAESKKSSFKSRLCDTYRSKRQGLIQRLIRRRAQHTLNTITLPERLPLAQADFFTDTGVACLRECNPDILITCNAPLLPARLFTVPTLGAFNIHYGIAPEYRGNHTLFYALKNKDHEHVGACMHRISEGIDTGHIMFKVYPEIKPSDSEIDIHILLAQSAGNLLLEFVKNLPDSAQAPGQQQTAKGRLYTNKQRGFWDDAQLPFFLPAKAETRYRQEVYF